MKELSKLTYPILLNYLTMIQILNGRVHIKFTKNEYIVNIGAYLPQKIITSKLKNMHIYTSVFNNHKILSSYQWKNSHKGIKVSW